MSSCCVKWCGKNSRTSNYTNDGITFHRFPKCPIRKKKWIDATRREETWYPRNTSVLCSRHFAPDHFHEMNQRRRLMDSAVPTLYLPILTSDSSNIGVNHTIPVPALERHDLDRDTQTSANQTPILSDVVVPVPDRHAHDLDASTSAKQVYDLNLQGIKPTAGAQVQQSLDMSTRAKMVHNPTMQDPISSTSQQQCSLLKAPTRKRKLELDWVKKRLCRRIMELTNLVKDKNVKLRKLRDANRKLKRRIISLKSLLLK